jgi:ubiquinone/menaquinone biosynthesis C-methylase UbiE
MAITTSEGFDDVSEVYDSTRPPPTKPELKAVSSELRGCQKVLDVGVGTGRFAKPLSEFGFEIIGIDISRQMMLKATEKGLKNLVVADVNNMPFRDKSFDATIIIHLFHLIPDWLKATREISRVTKNKALALLDKGPKKSNTSDDSRPPTIFQELWTHYTQLREKAGYPINHNKRMWQSEEEILTKIPPLKLMKISDEIVELSFSDIAIRFQQNVYLGLQEVPVAVHNKIIQELFTSATGAEGNREKTPTNLHNKRIATQLIEELAVWQPDQLLLN